jgi:predicted transcriptional regulator
MAYGTQEIAERLRAARAASGLSQRELSALAGIPQAQISRIEAGAVDLRLSSLVALVHALELELVLVPRKAVPAVRALTREALRNKAVHDPDPEADEGGARPAYSLDDDHDA